METNYLEIVKLGTSALSDAMDRLGIPGQALGIKPIDRNFMLCGPAFTVHNIPCDIKGGSVGDYIDDVPEGHVVVIDNGGRLHRTPRRRPSTLRERARAARTAGLYGRSGAPDRLLSGDSRICSRGTPVCWSSG